MMIHLTEAPLYDVFDTRMSSLVKRYLKYGSKMGRIDNKLKTLLSDAIAKAYYAGAEEGGIDPKDFNDEMSQEVDKLIYEQFEYLTQFIKDAEAARKDKMLQGPLLERIHWWQQTVLSAKFIGYNYAKRNEKVRWELGYTEEHCDTCLTLNGQVHTRKWFMSKGYVPGKPGANLDCHGFQCDCRLVAV